MKKNLLFICIGNACRSIMAEALTRHYWKETYEVYSAGISPLGRLAENTQKVLEESNISIRGLYSKSLWELDLNRFDFIINLTDHPLKKMMPKHIEDRIIDSFIYDPYGDSIHSYRKTRDAIERLVREEIPKWTE